MTGRFLLTLCLLGAAGAVGAPGAAAQESCPDGRITHIFVDNRSIFDLDEVRDQPFSWAYALANRLHVRTHHRFIRRELLFSVGDCYDPFRLEDSERILRRYDFISRVDVFGVRQDDGSWHVVVDTQDEWTTVVGLGVEVDHGVELRSAELTEENFLGRGMELGAFYRQTDAARLVGGRIATPRLFNTRLDASLTGGRTRVGTHVQQELLYPFVGEVGRFAARQAYLRREDFFTFSTGAEEGVTHLLLPVDEERWEVTVAARIGRPGNLTIFGIGVSRDLLRFPDFPGSVERVLDNDFGGSEPADPELGGTLTPQTLYDSGTRLNLLLGQRNIGFVQRRGLDALRGVQDIEVGTDMSLTVGRSVAASGPRPDDLFGRLRVYAATSPSPFTVVIDGGIEGRQIFAGADEDREGWRDVITEVDVLGYWQSMPWDDHTLFTRLTAAAGWNLDQPFQLTLGGSTGVRGYHDEEYPGARRLVLTLEDRIYFGWPFPGLFDLGGTLFGDVGRIWPGGVPWGTDSGWRGTVGAGLRIGFPAGSRSVVRIDTAMPLGASAGFSSLVFRVSFGDLLGISGGLRDPQVIRSQRTTVGPDRFNPIR